MIERDRLIAEAIEKLLNEAGHHVVLTGSNGDDVLAATAAVIAAFGKPGEDQ